MGTRAPLTILVISVLFLVACVSPPAALAPDTRVKEAGMKRIIFTEKAPKPIGPYSQAVLADDMLYVAGQLGLDPVTMKLKGETVEEQAGQAFRNVTAILEAAGLGLDDVVKVTVMLNDMHDFPALNKVYAGFFKENYPARVTFAAELPMGARVEIEVVAFASKRA